ncbi:MAG: C1 family peptidase [Pseudomonadota bacterium]
MQSIIDSKGLNLRGLESANSDLLDLALKLTRAGTWPVRFQGNRGTCNAFSVLAAEELFRSYKAGGASIERLSVEFLYHHARAELLSGIGFPVDPDLLGEGATFLAQVRCALMAHGVCPEHDLPYRDDPDLPPDYIVPRIPEAATRAAEDRKKRFPAEFAVNTKYLDETGKMVWTTDIRDAPVSEVFLAALNDHRPVVASLAILRDPGQAAWYGHRAIDFGAVAFPQNDRAAIRDAGAGHSVCIVGFLPGPDGNARDNGHFIFRNSFGTTYFAREPDRKNRPPRTPVPGFGFIPVEVVEAYCWEYLYHGSHLDSTGKTA